MILCIAFVLLLYIVFILFFMLVYLIITDYNILEDGLSSSGRSNCLGCGLEFCLKQKYNTDRYLYVGGNFTIDARCKAASVYIDMPILVVGTPPWYKYFTKLEHVIDWLLDSPHVELEDAIGLTKLRKELE